MSLRSAKLNVSVVALYYALVPTEVNIFLEGCDKTKLFCLLHFCVTHFSPFLLDTLSELFLLGHDCVTNHTSFSSVCLNKEVIWTALVSLHDRESAELPKRNSVTNRFKICISF